MRQTTDITRLGLILAAFCALAAAALAATYEYTRGPIQARQEQETLADLKRLLPAAAEFRRVELDGRLLWEGTAQGKHVGVVVKASASGYGGPLELFVAVDDAGSVTSVKVVSHSETPGIGARAAEPSFLAQFEGARAEDPPSLGEDVHGISGATISSRAVTEGVGNALSSYLEARASGSI